AALGSRVPASSASPLDQQRRLLVGASTHKGHVVFTVRPFVHSSEVSNVLQRNPFDVIVVLRQLSRPGLVEDEGECPFLAARFPEVVPEALQCFDQLVQGHDLLAVCLGQGPSSRMMVNGGSILIRLTDTRSAGYGQIRASSPLILCTE